MKFGYIRVSKDEQNLALQKDALERTNCDRIFEEKVSGASKKRPEYEKMILQLRNGDSVVVWRIDRLGRTTLQLIKLMTEFDEKGVNFISLSEGIDTSTKMGKLWFKLVSIFAENEREVIIERTRAGLQAARARGKNGGRPKGLSDEAKKKAKIAASLYKEGELTTGEIMATINIKSRATLYSYLRHANAIKHK